MLRVIFAIFAFVFGVTTADAADELAVYRVEAVVTVAGVVIGRPHIRAVEGAEASILVDSERGYAFRFVINSNADSFGDLRWNSATLTSELLAKDATGWKVAGKPKFGLRAERNASIESVGAAGPYRLDVRYRVETIISASAIDEMLRQACSAWPDGQAADRLDGVRFVRPSNALVRTSDRDTDEVPQCCYDRMIRCCGVGGTCCWDTNLDPPQGCCVG